ncbi:MAG: CHAT domain-containing protein [Ilumatobacter sp.]|uniref:CHAT domain-containing protein n=1 Tax=Ilumatobacter sp. TaxID=1967498 RepID=UPI00262F4725|nr:CHAT domain-containing protein [Ilumatobacter sp.]MDJ0768049.1 CHAT domain-containing protein [Ilumatobacter sp.]
MQSVTVEFQRFGESTGVIRTSDHYIRTNGTTGPTEEVRFPLGQSQLLQGMATLDYERFRSGDLDRVREVAEQFITDLRPFLEEFLPIGPPPDHDGSTYQVEIVTRALELAQLPFEILEEDAATNAVITRRIRQPWPPPAVVRSNKPKVLFAWAEPKQRQESSKRMEVPHERHRGLLAEVLSDWGGFEGGAAVEVENATQERIAEQLAPPDHGFTHVHLLAHGIGGTKADPHAFVRLEREPQPSTFLALEADDGTIDRCSPASLSDMFLPGVPRPASFAIATCHSGEVESIEAGGTLAHHLHRAGIPVVVASQLALTKTGSDQLITTFLETVIEGGDPREAIADCRRALREQQQETFYDRVALVGYVHVDTESDAQLADRKFEVELARLEAASKHADRRVKEIVTELTDAGPGLSDAQRHEAEDIGERFASVRERLERMARTESLTKAQQEERRGLQASSLKREAEAAWKLSRVLTGSDADGWRERSRDALMEAADAYERAAKTSRDHHWTWVQWLVLEAVVRGSLDERADDWITARAAAADAVERAASTEPTDEGDEEATRIAEDAIWARGSLMELSLLAPLVGRDDALAEAEQHVEALATGSRELGLDYAIPSTLAQLDRYGTWWGADSKWQLPTTVLEGAAHLHARLTALAEHDQDSQRREPTTTATREAAMFEIDMLPANEGDALWIEYGADPVRRILVDCGRKTAYRAVADRLGAGPDIGFELFVLTHVDADHIAGAVPLLQDARFGPDRVGDVWFNGWRHMNHLHRDYEGKMPGVLGARQGEFFGAVLRDREFPWNDAFGGHAVVIEDGGDLPTIELEGGMTLTLLGPTWPKLSEMRDRWEEDLGDADPDKRIEPGDYERALELLGQDRHHGPDVLGGGHEGPIVVEELGDVPFDPDDSEPNGSSISFLAEFGGRAVLFAGDAHAPQLAAAVRRLIEQRGLDGRLPVDALKMAHHGSARNNSYELLELLDCRRYLLSTNGTKHHHPDPEALARVLNVYDDGTEFHFNYASDESLPWADEDLQRRHGFQAFYPAGDAGLRVTL